MGNVMMMLKEQQQIIMDLSAAPDNGVESILLQIPAKELLISCALVSKQWHRILASKSFWIEWAELRNYRPEWRRFAGSLSLRSVRHVAIRRPFGRNFVRDAWDTTKFGRAECFVADRRWEFSERIVWTENETGHSARIEIPPRFIDGPKACPDTGEAVDECVAISYTNFQKRIVIKLADEGLTDEILDKFAPSIVVSELVANRRDCGSVYRVKSQLVKMFPIDVNVHDDKRTKLNGSAAARNGTHSPTTLQGANVTVWPKEEARCDGMLETEICAFGADGANVCFGDSGGPLLTKSEDGDHWEQIGITSRGNFVCESNGFFSMVYLYCDWMAKTTDGEIQCPQ
uniref:Peptidase S1 domain-containing protein n=1 Tax=Globodera pallida TaxID=36090 RepID=A0A183C760_GLOPA